MANWQPLQFVGGAYRDESRPWSAQDCVNYLPVPAEKPGTRSAYKLVGVPGLNPFSSGMQEAPVRGLHDVEGLLLSVTGNKLYKVRPNAVAIPVGTIPGTGRVDIAHNQITNGYEVMISNNQSGYVYNTVTDALTQVTDEGFPGMRSADYVDGYIAGIEPQGRFWFHSDLRQATQYNTLDRYDAESAPDKLLSLVVSHREVMILGARTGAFFRNTGATTGTFQNANGMEIEVGVANPYCAARLDNTVYWLGNDGLVYRLEGHTPVIVSTGPIADAMAEWDLATAFCMTWEDMKHKVIYFTFPSGQTFGYDAWTQEWHRRQSYGLDRWRVSALCQSNGVWYAGDYTNGRLYTVDWQLQAEADQPLVRRRVTGAIHADQNDVLVSGVELVLDTGKPTVEPSIFPVQPTPPTISGSAPDGFVTVAYGGYAYSITGGTAPYSVTVRSGTLPAGLSISSAGVIGAEVPTETGEDTFTLRVTDANGLWDEITDSIRIRAVWEWTQNFGNNLLDLASDGSGKFVAVGTGVAASGQVWFTDGEAATWTDLSASLPVVWQLTSIGYGDGKWVISRDFPNVLVTEDLVTFSQAATVNSNAYHVTKWTGARWVRIGISGACEWAVDPAGEWKNSGIGVAETVRIAVVDEAVELVVAFTDNGKIRRSVNGGQNWSGVTLDDPDPFPATGFTGAARSGDRIVAYKRINATTAIAFVSTNAGANWSVSTESVSSGEYNGGRLAYVDGEWGGSGYQASAPAYPAMYFSDDGLPPFSLATLIPGDPTVTGSSIVRILDNGLGTAVAIGLYSGGECFSYRYRYGA